MKIIETARVTTEQLDGLEEFAASTDPEIRDVLMSLTRGVREGDEIALFNPSETVTPNQAAERLGMSRTHLYKLLDSGAIGFHRVGRDRRISILDLMQFEAKRQQDRRELAERFANQRTTTAGAIDEIADLL